MRRIALRTTLLVWVTVGLATGLIGGCFSPDKPACAFSCATPPHTCPAGWTCGTDDVCHNPDSTGLCLIVIDAAQSDGDTDGDTSDGGVDGARDSAFEGGGQAGPSDARADVAGAGGPGG